MKLNCFTLAFLAIVAIAGTSFGAVLSFQANLDGLQEVPPNGSPAFGLVDLTIDDVSGQVTITSGSYQDLLGGATAVTLNGFASPGLNAGILLTLTLDTPGAATGTVSGGGMLADQAAINGFLAGNTYINIRSQVFPSGEIRGQVFAVPEPASIGAIALAAIGLLRRKTR